MNNNRPGVVLSGFLLAVALTIVIAVLLENVQLIDSISIRLLSSTVIVTTTAIIIKRFRNANLLQIISISYLYGLLSFSLNGTLASLVNDGNYLTAGYMLAIGPAPAALIAILFSSLVKPKSETKSG